MIDKLINSLKLYKELDAIVIEGYDGVGKSKVLQELSEYYGVIPYRPDYNLWQMFDHRQSDRWKVSGFFWDVYSHFQGHIQDVMLFDRGVISGAVYNNDMSIAMHYKEMLGNMNVLHILVTCDPEDYLRFYKARNREYSQSQLQEDCNKFVEYTERYIEALEIADVEYIVYKNEFDDTVNNTLCKSCGHYCYGFCQHPSIHHLVDGDLSRCDLSNDKEVQDL